MNVCSAISPLWYILDKLFKRSFVFAIVNHLPRLKARKPRRFCFLHNSIVLCWVYKPLCPPVYTFTACCVWKTPYHKIQYRSSQDAKTKTTFHKELMPIRYIVRTTTKRERESKEAQYQRSISRQDNKKPKHRSNPNQNLQNPQNVQKSLQNITEA